MFNSMSVKKAFTLSEVLIAMTVLGVIAAITVPSLINTYNDRMFVSAMKKNYSILSNAFLLARNFEYNDFEDWSHVDSDVEEIYKNYKYIKKYLYVIRECKNEEGCWSKEITKAYNRETAESASEKGIGNEIVTFTLNDGTNVCLDYWSQADTITYFGVSNNLLESPLSVIVDVNGDKAPNTLGRDVFAFVLTKNGLVPGGADNNSVNCKNKGVNYNYDCAAKYIKEY